jgi:phosphocarrier protein
MGVLLLCGSKGTKLSLEASGDDAERAISEIGLLIDNRFGEEE